MISTQLPADELRRLIELYCEGAIALDELARLDAAIQNDEQACRICREYLDLNAQLLCALRSPSNESEESTAPSSRPVSPILSSLGAPVANLSRPAFWSICCLSVLIAGYFGLVYWGISSQREIDRMAANAPPSEGNHLPIATILTTKDAEWDPASEFVARQKNTSLDGASIRPGESLHIVSGFVEIRLKKGATFVVEGPAIWSVESDNQAALKYGKLVARVPPRAIGFALDTPTIHIVDIGTEFGVEALPNGNTEVQVLVGEVAIAPNSESGDSALPAPVRLKAGQAVRVDEKSQLNQAQANDARFRELREKLSDSPVAPIVLRTAVFKAGAPTPLLGGEYQGCDDAMMLSWGQSNNFGKRIDLNVGVFDHPNQISRTLLRFDLSPLSGQVRRIQSVTLRLCRNLQQPVADSGIVEVYQLLPANGSWSEGTGAGALPGNPQDGVSWSQRKVGESWAGAPGADKPNVDYSDKLMAETLYTTKMGAEAFDLKCFDSQRSVVQNWIEHPKDNAGFLLKERTNKTNNRISFHSSESKEAGLRPELIIEYEPLAN